jgi:hypothetical protein
MSKFFQFETDFVESLRCIPMVVRFKLDTCGIKLKLNQWSHFDQEERQALVSLPCETVHEVQSYRELLQQLIWQRTNMVASELPIEANPPWQVGEPMPLSVQEKLAAADVAIAPTQWDTLTPLQRFALIKLSCSGHENNNFLPALKEFNLI